MSETQTKPRTVTTSEVIERMRAGASTKPVGRWRGTGRWRPVLDRCCECGYERRESRRVVCSLCGASA